MEPMSITPGSKIYLPNPRISPKTHFNFSPFTPQTHLNALKNRALRLENPKHVTLPTMADILASSKTQNLDLQLKTLGPFFRITARNLDTHNELGRAEGIIRVWLGGKILHLDSIRLRRETMGMERSIFGIGLFIGAVAIRYGYDCGCRTAELLAINDTDLYHSKVLSLPTASLFFFFFSFIKTKPALF